MISIIRSLDSTMEVLATRSDDPGVAHRAGLRELRKYRAQGYAGDCIGVVEVEGNCPVEVETSHRIRHPFGVVSRDYATHYVRQTYYHPVISPPCPTEAE